MRQRTAADLLASIGPLATQSVPVFQAILGRFQLTHTSPPDDRAIAQVLLFLLCEPVETNAPAPDKYAVHWAHFGPCVGTLNANISWSRVVALLDQLCIPTTQVDAEQVFGLAAVATYARRLAHHGVLDALWDHPWQHPLAQLTIIRGLLLLDSSVFDMSSWALHRVVNETLPLPQLEPGVDASLASAPSPNALSLLQAQAAAVISSRWNSQDVATLLSAGLGVENGALRTVVADLLDKAVKQEADLILIGFGQVPAPWPEIHTNFCLQLVNLILTTFQPNVQLVLWYLFQASPRFTLRALAANYVAHPANLPRLFGVIHDLGLVAQITDPSGITPSTPNSEVVLVFEIANLAERSEHFDLPRWLDQGISANAHAFFRASLDFLERKAQEELGTSGTPQLTSQLTSLTPSTVAAFLYALRSHGDEMTEEEIDSFKAVRNVCLQVHPRLMNLVPGSENMEPGLQVAQFAPEIQVEADNVYRSLYAGQIGVEDLMSLLKRAKNSDQPDQRNLFACLIHTLFDEYRCFERDYPARELGIAATVFGQIINEELVDYIPLGIAIRYALDALRKPAQSPLFSFGIQALQNFSRRLSEWPPLSQALLAIPAIVQGRPDVVRMIQEAQQRSSIPSAPNGDMHSFAQGGSGSEGNKNQDPDGAARAVAQAITSEPFTAIHPDDLDDSDVASQQEPSDEVSDKILFLVNNLSPSNLENKLSDAKSLIAPELYNWFAHYLVLQRVSIEPNNHPLYAQLIDGLEAGPRLTFYILRESMIKIKALLNSEQTLTSSSERTLLKNLASWLGSLTLARNKPIKHRNIAFKELLLQGYRSGRLIAAIPFACKVLEQCRHSVVFKLPNPWLAAVLALLVELYHYAGLKLNLKFEIEVMCKALEINMSELEVTSLLDTGAEEEALEPTNALAPVAVTSEVGESSPAPGVPENMSYTALLQSMFASLPDMIVIPAALNLFATNPTLKRMLCVAIERAVRDITPPIVERSAMIGNLSTKELVLKDFALEPDQTKLIRAAQQMTRDVVGSIAYVTSKDPLRTSMGQHAQRIFLDGGFNDATLPIEALATIMHDNVDMASKMIERAAQLKAVADLEALLAPAVAQRTLTQQANQANGKSGFADPDQALHIQYASALPPTLRLDPEGLTPSQLRVYDDFGRLSPSASAASIAPPPAVAAQGSPQAPSAASRDSSDASFALQLFTRFPTDFDRFVRSARSKEQTEEEAAKGPTSLAHLLPDSELLSLLFSVTELVRQHPRKEETALAFASKIVVLLLSPPSSPVTGGEKRTAAQEALATHALVTLLQRLCALAPAAAGEVSAWLVYGDAQWSVEQVPTARMLLQAQLIRVGELDAHWATLVGVREGMSDVAAAWVGELVQHGVATRTQLRATVRALKSVNDSGHASERYVNSFFFSLILFFSSSLTGSTFMKLMRGKIN